MATPTRFGTEFLVNTSTLNHQDTPSVAALANGKFVVVWEYDRAAVGQGEDIMATVFNADGSKFSVDTVVNQSRANTHQVKPVVAALTDGRFVVAWEDHDPDMGGATGDTSGSAIRMRIYNNDGTPAGNEQLVNTTKDNDQTEPAIAALAGGGFVISWTHDFGMDHDIRARAYGANGVALGNDFAVAESVRNEIQSTVAGLSNGNYVIAWNDTNFQVIRAEVFAGNGASQSLEFNVSGVVGDTDPAIAGLSDGGFIVTWTSPTLGQFNIHGKLFNASGTPVAFDTRLAGIPGPTDPDETQSAVAAMAGGQFIVTFTDGGATGADNSGLHIGSRTFVPSSLGPAATGDEFIANQTHVNGSQFQPTVATLSDGRVIIIWTDPGETPGAPDVSGNSVRGRIFDPRTGAVNLIGTNLGDDWVGTGFDDVMDGAFGDDRIDGGAGNDSLIGGAGDDTLIGGLGTDLMQGGAGNDTYFADDPGDQVIELAGEGVDQVFSSVSFVLGANVETLVLAGAAANGTGNALANTIIGNALANLLDGGSGADLMQGGAGSDTYVVDDPGDVADESAAGSDGIDTVLAAVSFSLSDGAHAKGDIENLTLIGSGAINGTGNALANILVGNAGANVLNGLGGNDLLTGGDGPDQFVFDTAISKDPAVNLDHVTDFLHGTDKLVLSKSIFKKLELTKKGKLDKDAFVTGKKADDDEDHVVYNKKTGVLAYDKDGDGGKKAIAFAILDGSPDDVSHKDFLIVA